MLNFVIWQMQLIHIQVSELFVECGKPTWTLRLDRYLDSWTGKRR